jgi:hypothetical protein
VFNTYKDQAMLKFQELKNGLTGVKDDDALFTGYIKAHRDLTRAERGIPNPKGVTEDDALMAIMEAEDWWVKQGKELETLRAARDNWNNWTHDNILFPLWEGGLISEALYDDVIKNNKWYATYNILERMPEDMHKIPLSSREYFSVSKQDIVKPMTGTQKLIDDPIEATIRKFTDAEATIARNKVANMLIEEESVQEFLRPVAQSKKQFAILEKMGFDPVVDGSWSKEFDTISRFKNGRVEKYLFPKEIAESMKQLTPWQAPRVIQGYNKIFRASATTLRIPFMISNAARDAFMAYISSPVYRVRDILGPFQKDWAKGAYEGFKHEFLGKSNLVDEYLRAGGPYANPGAEAFEEGGRMMLKKGGLFKKTLARQGAEAIVSPFTFIKKINSVVELAPRLGTFERGMKLGYELQDAAMIARQATIDFNRGGTWTKVANQFIPFLNARIQAKVVLAQSLKRDAKGTLAKTFASTTLPGAALYLYNRLYYSEEYDDIPEYIKQNYFTFITGKKMRDGKLVPEYFVISKGDAGMASWNPLEFGLDKIWKKDPTAIHKLAINFLSDLSPIEFAKEGDLSMTKLLGAVTPPMVKGPLEWTTNLKFYQGSKVVPHYMMKLKPPELQYRETTPEAYKWLGKKTGLSPLQLQNLAANVVTGYGREGLSPKAMWDGIRGRVLRVQGGDMDRKAFIAMKNIETGYAHTKAYAEEMIKKGERKAAIKLVQAWNKGLSKTANKFKQEYPDHADRGEIMRSYILTSRKIYNIFRKAKTRK